MRIFQVFYDNGNLYDVSDAEELPEVGDLIELQNHGGSRARERISFVRFYTDSGDSGDGPPVTMVHLNHNSRPYTWDRLRNAQVVTLHSYRERIKQQAAVRQLAKE